MIPDHLNQAREIVRGRVRELRVAAGLSQADLARRLSTNGLPGMYAQTIYKIETGRRELRFEEGLAIAKLFGVSPESLAVAQPVREPSEVIRLASYVDARLSEALDELGRLALTATFLQGRLRGVGGVFERLAEALNAAGTPRTAPRSDEDAADVLADSLNSERPTEARTASERWQIPARQLDGSCIGKPVKIGMRIGDLRYVQHNGITTRLLLDCGPSGDFDWTTDSDALVEVQW